jgi:hypothetical protein
MRLRQWLSIGGCCALVPIAYFAVPGLSDTVHGYSRLSQADQTGIREAATWEPKPEEIASAVVVGQPGDYTDARHTQFASMFQQRYRGHSLAVAVRFLSNTRIKVLCAAVMPRWDMARVALQIHEEAQKVFGGTDYEVDIFETYISARHLKIGELRTDADSGKSRIDFDSRYDKPVTKPNPATFLPVIPLPPPVPKTLTFPLQSERPQPPESR